MKLVGFMGPTPAEMLVARLTEIVTLGIIISFPILSGIIIYRKLKRRKVNKFIYTVAFILFLLILFLLWDFYKHWDLFYCSYLAKPEDLGTCPVF